MNAKHLLAAALDYTAHGWPVFLVWRAENGLEVAHA